VIIFDHKTEKTNSAALDRFARTAKKMAGVTGEVAVLVTDRARMQDLNRQFRRKDFPTDVLSFPLPEGGDIAVCAEIALENSARLKHSFEEELKVLILHGMLHLAGYDHESDDGKMARREALLRSRLKLADSLIGRSGAKQSASATRAGKTARQRRGRR
jgi:probable rRNA maturation factor